MIYLYVFEYIHIYTYVLTAVFFFLSKVPQNLLIRFDDKLSLKIKCFNAS